MYPIFGGYWGYLAAPLWKVQEHRLRLIATKEDEAKQNAEVEAEIEQQRRAAERSNGRYGR